MASRKPASKRASAGGKGVARVVSAIARKAEEGGDLLHLTEDQVEELRDAARRIGRYGDRDSTMILVAFRHGLRVSELVRWKWEQVDLDKEEVYVLRRKGSRSKMHYLEEDEVKALKKLPGNRKGWVFTSERGEGDARMTESGFRKLVGRAGKAAGFTFPVHPHMLRHGCGFWKHKAGWATIDVQNWLGHVNIQHTVHYVAQDADAFRRARARETRES